MYTDLNVADHPYELEDGPDSNGPRFTDVYPPELYSMAYALPRGSEYVDERGQIHRYVQYMYEDTVLRRVVRLTKQCERVYYFKDFGGEAASHRCIANATHRAHNSGAPEGDENYILCRSCLRDDEISHDLSYADYIIRLDSGIGVK